MASFVENLEGVLRLDFFTNKHDCFPDNISQHFKVLPKCKTKHECLIYEMLYIRELSPSLNVQSDSTQSRQHLVCKLCSTLALVFIYHLIMELR